MAFLDSMLLMAEACARGIHYHPCYSFWQLTPCSVSSV